MIVARWNSLGRGGFRLQPADRSAYDLYVDTTLLQGGLAGVHPVRRGQSSPGWAALALWHERGEPAATGLVQRLARVRRAAPGPGQVEDGVPRGRQELLPAPHGGVPGRGRNPIFSPQPPAPA